MQRYQGKLLLFGEHTILKGSRALAMPLPRYEGHWAYTSEAIPAHLNLENFLSYLQKLAGRGEMLAELQLGAFERDVNKGLYFESNIPVGYGAGSSGALCAAVYERYAFNPIPRSDEGHFILLKQQLAQLEGFFHGSSSGADPLICYLGQAVLLFPDGHAQRLHVEPGLRKEGRFFLLDTGITRKTGPLVELFLKKCEAGLFESVIRPALLPATQAAIDAYLSADGSGLWTAAARISALQLEHLPELLPEHFEGPWAEGLESGVYALKLCGAGGGGFILGYTLDAESAGNMLAKLQPAFLGI